MCGIVGILRRTGSDTLVDELVDGLRVLEYRGYDSAGIAAVQSGRIAIRRTVGRLDRLEALLAEAPFELAVAAGIGHTRWATHGQPSDRNAHPHSEGEGRIALVHNGILENYEELRDELLAQGAKFQSETDTEVLAHLIDREMRSGTDFADAVRESLRRVRGYYAIAVLTVVDGRSRLVCARNGPPLCVAVADGTARLASDVLALLPFTREVAYLEDGDLVELTEDGYTVRDSDGREVEREVTHITWDAEDAGRGAYPHHMLKEIHEQPDVLARTTEGRIDLERGNVVLAGRGWEDDDLVGTRRIQIVACGTALHAGIVARYLIEEFAGIPVDFDYASEFRDRSPRLVPGTIALAISQSGETADTLAALRLARELGAKPMSICNVEGSTVVRDSVAHLLTKAGPEVGVASTKAFVAQLVAALLLAVRLGRANGRLSEERAKKILGELRLLRPLLEQVLAEKSVARIQRIATEAQVAKGFLFLGRGVNYPVALEGALKLKEISYMHAEGYPAGEMKHGPIALVEPEMWTVVVNSQGLVAEKVRSNIAQVRARGGRVVVVGSDEESLRSADAAIPVPKTSEWLSPILNVVPLQLLAYYVAVERGCDVDKPRNLAKSVTVE